MTARTAVLTFVALCAFAANSVLARLALTEPAIDPASFTLIRIASGAFMLALVSGYRSSRMPVPDRRSFASAFWLFLYAIAFAWAYLSLGAATGALILFAAVQIGMIAIGLSRGERVTTRQALGIVAAMAGLAWLLAPRLEAPPLVPALAMAAAGLAWGVYTLRGKSSAQPLAANAANFVAAVPFCAIAACFADWSTTTTQGVALAVLSGAVASGLGYVVWFAAMRGLAASQAAVVQLAVPVIAAIGGVALLGETMTAHLLGAGTVILVGILLALAPDRPR